MATAARMGFPGRGTWGASKTEIRSGKFECTGFRVDQSEEMHKYFLRTKRLLTE